MGSAVVVRETKLSHDFLFILRLVEVARIEGEPWALSWTAGLLADELSVARVFVAVEVDGADGAIDRPCGFLIGRPAGEAWEITLTAVDVDARKNGIFSALLSGFAGAMRRDAAATEILLEVRADNEAAISAYEANGFKAVGRRRAYYRDGADALLYKRV